MKRRDVWGIALTVTAALGAWADHAIYEAYRAAARDDLLLYIGMPADSVSSWFRIAAILCGGAGLSFLLPSLIRRIRKKIPRRTVGWTIGVAVAVAVPYFGVMLLFAALGAFGIGDTTKIVAADGTSVLVSQDGFDGDSVVIYAEHDEFHYKRVRDAPEIAGWPRVKDQDCRLQTAGNGLLLICGDKELKVYPEDAAG